MPVCWECGRTQHIPHSKLKRPFVKHVVDGAEVDVHTSCAKKAGYLKVAPKKGRLPQRERTVMT
jgi:hypothetical protein